MDKRGLAFMIDTLEDRYSYNFSWLSRQIIQYPQDIVAMQEIIWTVRPDLIIETGIAHGGSLVLSASMLALLDYCDAVKEAQAPELKSPARRVLGVDIDIRADNLTAIKAHPLAHRIDMIEGSSVNPAVVSQVLHRARSSKTVLVCLDSNHTHEHVLLELESYAPMVSKGSYCVVFDTIIEHLPAGSFPKRPWGKGNSPMSAVREYLRRLQHEGRRGIDGNTLRFEVDASIEAKLLISVAPEGYLHRV